MGMAHEDGRSPGTFDPRGAASTLLAGVIANGWAIAWVPSGTVAEAIGCLAEVIGDPVDGRHGRLFEDVVPRSVNEAHPRSLSRIHGLGALPLHVELSHRARPCRYVLLGCVDPGSGGAATTLLDRCGLDFGGDLTKEMGSAPVLVRSGRRSFYSTLLPRCRSWLRFDRDCIEPVGSRGAAMFGRVSRLIDGSRVGVHRWAAGDVLLIDNWRVLHGREAVAPGDGRRMLRVMIHG